MFTAMEEIREDYRTFQRALRMKPFATMEKAISYAIKRGQQPFVMKGQRVVWTKQQEGLTT